MDKALLNSFISKYSLGGTVEAVAWEVGDGCLKTKIVSDVKDVLGEIELKTKAFKDLEGKKFGIYTTSKLVKMLAALDDEITLTLESAGDHPKSLKLVDSGENGLTTRASYALSDLAIIPTVPPLKPEHMPTEYEVAVKVDDKFIELFTRTKAALPEVVLFAIHATAKKVDFIFGQTDINTNTISFSPEVIRTSAIEKRSFTAELFKNVLVANKGVEAELLVSSVGLAKIVYSSKEYTATYYLVAKT